MLRHVRLVNDTLIARDDTAVAKSEIITQEDGEPDFESVRDARIRWKLANVCDYSRSSVDKAIITGNIKKDDRIIIIDNKNKPYETTVSEVTLDLTQSDGLIPNMTSATEPSGKVVQGTYWIFSGVYHKTYSGGDVTYEFPKPTYVKSFYISTYGDNVYSVRVYGSNDGNNFVLLGDIQVPHSSWFTGILDIPIPGTYKFYKFNTHGRRYNRIYNLQLFGDAPAKTIDTSAATNGTTPKYIYRFMDKLKFNSNTAIEKDRYYEFGTYGDHLYVQNLYNDVPITGRTIRTEIDFSAAGNTVLEITGQIYKKPEETTNGTGA